MEHWWIDTERRTPKASENNLSKRHIIYHKSHTKWFGIGSASRWCEAGDQTIDRTKKFTVSTKCK